MILKKSFLTLFFLSYIFTSIWADASEFQGPTKCKGDITSGFKTSKRPDHLGIDIARGLGKPVYAAGDGTVTKAYKSSSYGWVVYIDHRNGYETRYAHMKETPLVKSGNQVKAGQQIGKEGNTGDSRGVHLHFEVRKDNNPIDPQTPELIPTCLPGGGKGGEKDPGKDHPDETYDISDENFPLMITENKSVMIAKDIGIFNEGFSNCISMMVYNWNSISLVEIEEIDSGITKYGKESGTGEKVLDAYPIIVVPSGGFIGLDTSEILKYEFRKYVSDGGILISFAQQHGYEFNCLPGGEVKGYGWGEDQSCWTNAAYVDTYKPCFAGQTSANLDVNVDGYFTQWPGSATILLRRTKNNMPCMLMYPYGKGWVIASTLYSDWGYGHNQTSNAEVKLVRDLISWAKDINNEIPEFKPDEEVKLDVEITNNTDKSANKVILTLIDPDRNIIATQTITISIPPHQKILIPYSPFPIPSSLGIWWIDYELQDNAGNTIQPQTEGERFAISKNLVFELDWGWWLKLGNFRY